MTEILSEEVSRFVRAVGPTPDDVLVEMDEYAREEGFPTVGPGVGATLSLLTRMGGARRVFEFGSGFGYSAYWFARSLPPGGQVVLTEHDPEELDLAREYLERGGLADRAVFEEGDAFDAFDRHEGPFDVVLLDHQKERYPEAFEVVRPSVPEGGLVVADNAMTAGIVQFEKLLELVEGGDPDGVNDHTQGVADYLADVRADPAFETVVFPLGEGIAVSYRTG